MTPTRPNGVDLFPDGDVDDQVYIGVVVLVASRRNLDERIR